jgi:riboflavin kinase, archaea type
LRTDKNESGEGIHPKTLVEVACEVKLREKYHLKDGDIVQIEVKTDRGEAE